MNQKPRQWQRRRWTGSISIGAMETVSGAGVVAFMTSEEVEGHGPRAFRESSEVIFLMLGNIEIQQPISFHSP